MKLNTVVHKWILTNEELIEFAENHKYDKWIAFDTEFIGEKRDKTLLCLIQISSVQGIFLIDCLKVTDLQPFLEIVQNPEILKITHAGDNEYKVLYELYRITPANVADVQIAAGFAGYKYPTSLANLLSNELGHKLDKSYTVIDWEQRPLHENYVLYAIEDVLFIKDLFDKLMHRITEKGMKDWVECEFQTLTNVELYASPPEKEAIQSMYQTNYSIKERVIVLRLFQWRSEMAEKTGKLKERFLPKKWISVLAKAIKTGKQHLLNNRTIPQYFIGNHWKELEQLAKEPASVSELELVKNIQADVHLDPIHESLQDLVLSLIKYQCRLKGVDPVLVIPPSILKTLKKQISKEPSILETTWRFDLLGKEFLEWIDFDNLLQISFEKDKIIIEKNQK
jgi:ribonuclease D